MPRARFIVCLLLFWLVGDIMPAEAQTPPSPAQIERLSAKCATGSAPACYALGQAQRDSDDEQIRNPEAAARAFKAACDLNHIQACNDLGDQYAKGEGVGQFTSVALYLYEGASKYFTVLGVLFPTFGAGIAGIRYFGDFERFAAISEITAEKLSVIHTRSTVLAQAPSDRLHFGLVADLARETDDVVFSEIENWQAVFRAKQITVPV